MFTPVRNNQVVKFRILIEDVLLPFWSLACHLLTPKAILRKYAPNIYEDAKNLDFNSTEEDKRELVNDALVRAFNQFNQELVDRVLSPLSLDQKAKSLPILTICQARDNSSFIYISDVEDNSSSSQDRFNKYIKGKTIITDFFKKADDKYLNNLIAVDNEVLYSKVLDTDNPLQIEMPILPLSMMNLENGEIEYDEVERIWFNRKRILDYFDTFPQVPTKVQIISIKQENIGIIVDDFFFPLIPILGTEYLKAEKTLDYVWFCLKYNVLCCISCKDKKYKFNGNDLLNSFLNSCKGDNIISDITKLRDNLYIDSENLSDGCSRYFDRMLKIQKLKKFETYKFYIDEPDDDKNGSVFGIYQNIKIDPDYNLKYLFENKQHKLNDKSLEVIDKEPVWVLKPVIAQFFLSDFFERFLFAALDELQNDNIIEGSLKNYNAKWQNGNKCEIDAIVKSYNRLFFIEAKTTLTVSLINEYIKKCQKLIKDFREVEDKLCFIIVGYFSNPELNVFKNTVSPSNIPKGYNDKREKINTIPYYFEVPIDQASNHTLICFTEPSYNMLKSTLTKIFKE